MKIVTTTLFNRDKGDPVSELCVVGIKLEGKTVRGISDNYHYNNEEAKLKAVIQAWERAVAELYKNEIAGP